MFSAYQTFQIVGIIAFAVCITFVYGGELDTGKEQNFGKADNGKLQNWNAIAASPYYKWFAKRALLDQANAPFGDFNYNRGRFVNWGGILGRRSFEKRFGGDKSDKFVNGDFDFQKGLQKWLWLQ